MRVERLDLHGYTVAAAIYRFVERYNALLPQASDPNYYAIEAIHGKSRTESGSIRETLRDYLAGQGKRIKGFDAQLALRGADYLLDGCGRLAYMHGEDATHNGGCTIVIPRQRIASPREWLRYR